MTPEYIIIHHSATEDSETLSWPVIRSNHIRHGFSDIGYHFGIERVRGSVETMIGRFPNAEGAHCRDGGMNGKSIGICIVGNFDTNVPPVRSWLAAIRLVRFAMNQYGIPRENVLGHREVDGVVKSCPGQNWNMDGFRSAL